MRKFKKSIICLIMAISMFASLCGFVYDHNKVYDDAELFTNAQRRDLEDLAWECGEMDKLDIVIYTTDGGYGIPDDAEIAGEQFFDDHNFGYDDVEGSGVILTINMNDRSIGFSCTGIAQAMIQESDEDRIIDGLIDRAGDGDYYEAAKYFIKSVHECAEEFKDDYEEIYENWYEGKYAGYYAIAKDVEPNFFTNFKNPLITFLIAGVIALIVVLFMCIGSKTKMTVTSRTYMKNGKMLVQRDVFINKTTTSRTIQSNSSGSRGGGGHSHRSSSGRSHSGRSGRF